MSQTPSRVTDVSTNVGERGITLSGGQKQRICIARAAYMDTEIVLLDDPLSAVDAHVGHHLLTNCILSGPMASRTRILVTHHFDVLPRADVILMMDSDGQVGRIIEQGSYTASLSELLLLELRADGAGTQGKSWTFPHLDRRLRVGVRHAQATRSG